MNRFIFKYQVSQAWNKAETSFVSNGCFLFIHHVHQACDESFAGIDGILEVYFVYVGDVETDTLCVLCIIKYEWKYRLVHVYGVADFAYDIYGAQNEAYMSRSAEKWVRGLCFNELGVCG